MARRGLLGKNRPADPELSRVYDEVRDAFEKVAVDHDVLSSPVFHAISSGPIPAGATIVRFAGGAAQTLTLPPANAQGQSVGAVMYIVNTSPSGVTIVPTRGDTLNAATSAIVGGGLLVIAVADGVNAWVST